MGERLTVRDSEGNVVGDGDIIHFSYGIPPVAVDARVVERRGKLIALCAPHKPAECDLKKLRRYVGDFYKAPSKATGKHEIEARIFADRRTRIGAKK